MALAFVFFFTYVNAGVSLFVQIPELQVPTAVKEGNAYAYGNLFAAHFRYTQGIDTGKEPVYDPLPCRL